MLTSVQQQTFIESLGFSINVSCGLKARNFQRKQGSRGTQAALLGRIQECTEVLRLGE